MMATENVYEKNLEIVKIKLPQRLSKDQDTNGMQDNNGPEE